MLEMVRKAGKSWIAKVLLGLLVASFGVFGISDVFRTSLGSEVVTVGDQEITAERFLASFNREMRDVGQRFGQPVDTTLARQLGLDRQVAAQLAAEATLDQAVDELSLSAPDQAVARVIVGDPGFQGPGGFDDARYKYALAQIGYSVETYEDEVRHKLIRNQLTAALVGGAAAAPGLAETLYTYQGEARRFDYVVLNVADHTEAPEAPDDAALAAFHDAHADQFSTPESRDLAYIEISIDALAKDQAVDEDAVRALYENRASIYRQPERRAIYQVIFDDNAAALAALAKLTSGATDFDGLLAERGETRPDVSLGEVTRGDLDTAVGEAAFALTAPGVAGPVDTGFGFALIEVAAITPAETTPFEDARAELEADLAREAALDAAPSVAGDLEDLRAGGATLEEAAQEMGLDVRTVKGLTRDGGDGLTGAPEFLTEAFASDVEEDRDVVETTDGSFFVLRVDAEHEAAVRPLAEVRDEVLAAWTADARRKALEERMKVALDRVDEGDLLALVADEAGVDMESEGPAKRSDGWVALPAELLADLFTKPMGGAGYGPAPGRDDAFVIAQVVGIEPPDMTSEEGRAAIENLRAQINRSVGSDTLQYYLTAKQAAVGVDINERLIDSLLGGRSGDSSNDN